MTLLLALGILLQEKTAEEAFKTIEETIAKAKTVEVDFEVTRTTANDKIEASGTLLLQEGNRAHFGVSTVFPGEFVLKTVLASDGTKVRFTSPSGLDVFSLKEQETPEHLVRSFHVSLLQLPLLDSFVMTSNPQAGLLDLRKVVKRQSVAYGTGDENVGILQYSGLLDFSGREKFENKNVSYVVTLEYDRKTWIPRKRKVAMVMGNASARTTETYHRFILGGDIPKERFALPTADPRNPAEKPSGKDQ